MRIRTIKPEFWASESLSRISREARLLFIGLFSACDDHGRTRAASRFLASLLFPYDEDAPKLIDGWLKELEQENCIRRYVVDGDTYLDIPKWPSHQKIDRPSESKLPPFDAGSLLPRESSRTLVLGSGNRDQGSGNREQGTSAPAKPVRERNELFDSLASITGADPNELTKDAARACGVALAQIKGVTPTVTPAEITRRAKNYTSHFEGAAITPNALAKHWATCANPPAKRGRYPSEDELPRLGVNVQ